MLTQLVEQAFLVENGKKRKLGELKYKSGSKKKIFDNLLNIYLAIYIVVISYEFRQWIKKGAVPVTYVSLIGGIFASLTYGLHAYQHADAKQMRNTLISGSVLVTVMVLKTVLKYRSI
jgi:hypothetical protein